MKEIINKLRGKISKRVLILGDVMLDEYTFGMIDRISPEAPVPVFKEERKEYYLGGAANTAANCKHIKLDTYLLGIVGSADSHGKKIACLLSDIGMRSDGLVFSQTRGTTVKKRLMAASQQCFRVDREDTHVLSQEERSSLIAKFDKLMTHESIILLSDYAKGILDKELIAYVVRKARAYNCLVIVDPKGPDFSKYKGVDYIKPNMREFIHMCDFYGLNTNGLNTKRFVKNGQEICKRLDIAGLIVTMGDKGIRFISNDNMIYAHAHKREVYDLSGAGDTVFAFLALSFVHKLAIPDMLLVANRAASVAIAHCKTYAVSLDELIDKEEHVAKKVYHDWARLKIELDWQKSDGKTIVFTNGCFDLLHSGHIYFLAEAKKQGDILVVALNTDASIKKLGKGADRPINNLQERAQVISALGFVDFVTSFDQNTPKELIEYLRPDVLVKGGDYKAQDIVGYDIVTSSGGKVHIVDFVHNRSTTRIVDKMRSLDTPAVAKGYGEATRNNNL